LSSAPTKKNRKWEKAGYDLLVLRISCRQLLELTCQVANALKTEGVKKGDRVAIYMPVSPLLAASMLACARIGAVHRWVTLMLGIIGCSWLTRIT